MIEFECLCRLRFAAVCRLCALFMTAFCQTRRQFGSDCFLSDMGACLHRAEVDATTLSDDAVAAAIKHAQVRKRSTAHERPLREEALTKRDKLMLRAIWLLVVDDLVDDLQERPASAPERLRARCLARNLRGKLEISTNVRPRCRPDEGAAHGGPSAVKYGP